MLLLKVLSAVDSQSQQPAFTCHLPLPFPQSLLDWKLNLPRKSYTFPIFQICKYFPRDRVTTYHLKRQIFSTFFPFVLFGHFSNVCLVSSLFKMRKHYRWGSENTSPTEHSETSNRSTLFGLRTLFLLFHMLVYGAGDETECLSPRELVWRLLRGEEGGETARHIGWKWKWMCGRNVLQVRDVRSNLSVKFLRQSHAPITHNAWFIFSVHLHTKLI